MLQGSKRHSLARSTQWPTSYSDWAIAFGRSAWHWRAGKLHRSLGHRSASKCMLTRKKEKPLLENERALLDAEMQPQLFKLATAQ